MNKAFKSLWRCLLFPLVHQTSSFPTKHQTLSLGEQPRISAPFVVGGKKAQKQLGMLIHFDYLQQAKMKSSWHMLTLSAKNENTKDVSIWTFFEYICCYISQLVRCFEFGRMGTWKNMKAYQRNRTIQCIMFFCHFYVEHLYELLKLVGFCCRYTLAWLLAVALDLWFHSEGGQDKVAGPSSSKSLSLSTYSTGGSFDLL